MTADKQQQKSFTLTPQDNKRLAILCGQYDENLRRIEQHCHVIISNRGHHFHIAGKSAHIEYAIQLIHKLHTATLKSEHISESELHLLLQEDIHLKTDKNTSIITKNFTLKPRNKNQQRLIQNIQNYDINFAVGPAGTGKTYLAVACAIAALESEQVRRILLVRPVVEAGEHLGFLPGDLTQKVDPYFRPLYDALYEMLGFEKVAKLLEKNIIEIAPLAYMRGRTLNESFIILDESQNTTQEQMKMFLTRIGFGSITVLTGDITQVDLPKGKLSGLMQAMEVLRDLTGISFTYFQAQDVVRHPLIQAIVQAYERHGKS